MLGDHFYHSIIRKTVSVFGTLFNDLKVVRRGGDGMESMVKIPLSYGPKQKFLARLDQQRDLDDVTKVALKLPRMSFELQLIGHRKIHEIPVLHQQGCRNRIRHVQ